MPRSTEGKTPRKTPESSAPRPYIGYVSSQWHTRQPQAPQQLAAISWCRSHACRATERAVLMPRSAEGKPPPTCQNRVLCDGKWAMGVGMGISDSPRQLVNQLQPATACGITAATPFAFWRLLGGFCPPWTAAPERPSQLPVAW